MRVPNQAELPFYFGLGASADAPSLLLLILLFPLAQVTSCKALKSLQAWKRKVFVELGGS